MALIVDTYPGKDLLVKRVRIKTQNGEYDRPITHSNPWLPRTKSSVQTKQKYQDIFVLNNTKLIVYNWVTPSADLIVAQLDSYFLGPSVLHPVEKCLIGG